MAAIRLLLFCSIFGLSFLVNQQQAFAAPQDLKTAILLAAGQVKDVFDNGAAARDSKGFEFAGMTFKNDMEMGFGDAIKKKKGGHDDDDDDDDDRRRKRAAVEERSSSKFMEEAHSSTALSPDSLEYYNEFVEDKQRHKRSDEDSDSSSSSSSSESNE